jgi:hypothetical protein
VVVVPLLVLPLLPLVALLLFEETLWSLRVLYYLAWRKMYCMDLIP